MLLARRALAGRMRGGWWSRPLCTVGCSAVPPCRVQLAKLALASAIPFVGFGIADNGIMILAGDQIDLTLGEKLGWSTLAAAGFGNTISDVAGLWIGDYIEALAARFGVRSPPITAAQAQLLITRRVKLAANVVGMTTGCLIGMLPLLFLEDRKQVYFDEDELALFQNVFAPYGVTPREFFSLMHMCRWHIAEPGTILVHNGDILDRVLLLHSGVAQAWETDATGRRRLRYLYAGKEPLMDQGAKATKSKSRSLEEGSIASVPVLERRNSGGEVELRSIIGGSALINSGLCGREYPNEVVLTRRSKYVEWPLSELQEAMRNDKAVEAAVLNILYRELARKVHLKAGVDRSLSDYHLMLSVVLADGIIHPAEKALLRDYAIKHDIPEEAHLEMLHSLSWTVDEFEHGIKQSLLPEGKRKAAHHHSKGGDDIGATSSTVAAHAGEAPPADAQGHVASAVEPVDENGDGVLQLRGSTWGTSENGDTMHHSTSKTMERDKHHSPSLEMVQRLTGTMTGKMAAVFKGETWGEGASQPPSEAAESQARKGS